MIPISIVGHINRAESAEKLCTALGAEAVCMDDVNFGPGVNHERAWRWVADNQNEDWGVVLEDDALPVKGFREQLDMVLEKAPSAVVSLYLGRGRPPHWQPSIQSVIMKPACFLYAPELLHHVGVAIKTPLIPFMLDYLDDFPEYRTFKMPIDEAIGHWVRKHGMNVSYTHPSIVEHDLSLPSTITEHTSQHATESGRRDDPREVRKAWMFGSRKMWNNSACRIPDPAR